MNRRSFMQSILAAGVAPWVVTTAGVLMPARKISRVTMADLLEAQKGLDTLHLNWIKHAGKEWAYQGQTVFWRNVV